MSHEVGVGLVTYILVRDRPREREYDIYVDVDQFPIDAFNVLFLSICFCSNAVLIYIIQEEKPPRRCQHTSFYINRALRVGQLDKIDIASTWKTEDEISYISLN